MFKFKLKFSKFKLKGLVPDNLNEFENYVKSCKNLTYKFKYIKNLEPGILYLLVFGNIGIEFHFKENGLFEFLSFSGTKFYKEDLKK